MDYKATLNLPKTAFPMKANLPESEPKMLAWWEQFGMYKRLRQVAADRPLWILHDGPPYANGNIHLGDRKSTRLNSSHVRISYAVFCLKKKERGRYVRPARHDTER